MNKEIKLLLAACDRDGVYCYERDIIAYSTYDLAQKCLKWCIAFAKDPKVMGFEFIDQEGTVQRCGARFFREGTFEH